MDFSQIVAVESDEDDRSFVDMGEYWRDSEGNSVIVYAREITAQDHNRVAKAVKGWPFEPSFEGLIHMLTLVCQNADGTPFFKNPIKDRKELAKSKMGVVNKLIELLGDVQGTGDEDQDVLLGNSEMTR